MYRGSDSVFRLSLIGIALILVFFLLIMFSRMPTHAAKGGAEASQRQQEGASPQQMQQAFESAQQELRALLSQDVKNPDEIIRGLLDNTKMKAELATEKKYSQDLREELARLEAGLNKTRKILAQAGKTSVLGGTSMETLISALELHARLEQEFRSMSGQAETELTDSEITSRAINAVHFKRNIESLIRTEHGIEFVPGQESAWERWLVTDSQSFQSILEKSIMSSVSGQDDLHTLRAQIGFLRTTRPDKPPPCWFGVMGEIQFLFAVELHPRHIIIKSAWPPIRETEALSIPGVKQLLEYKQIPYPNFTERAQSIGQHSARQWCRHSVQVVDNVRSGKRSEEIHRELENTFVTR